MTGNTIHGHYYMDAIIPVGFSIISSKIPTHCVFLEALMYSSQTNLIASASKAVWLLEQSMQSTSWMSV